MLMFPNASTAATVRSCRTPTFVGSTRPVVRRALTAPGVTVVRAVPRTVALPRSATATVRAPAVLIVTGKVASPLTSALSGAKTARGSVLVEWTLPEYPVATWQRASMARTVTVTVAPVVAATGPVTANRTTADTPNGSEMAAGSELDEADSVKPVPAVLTPRVGNVATPLASRAVAVPVGIAP